MHIRFIIFKQEGYLRSWIRLGSSSILKCVRAMKYGMIMLATGSKKQRSEGAKISLARARHYIVAKSAQLHCIQKSSKHITHVRQYKHRVIYMISEVTYTQEHDVCV